MKRGSARDLGGATGTGGATGADRTADASAAAIEFPQGLPGFPDATRFTLLPLDPSAGGMLVMQSTEDPDLRFLVLPYLEHRLPLRRVDLDRACAVAGVPCEHAAVLLVVTRRPALADADAHLYVNLRAPLLVDTERRMAVQCVLPCPDYSVRHPLAA